ncbi:hypothetical protein V7152_08025 [Neobacillus drentensis]|uniref:hypothetical protein n=1 Tax=Neobacillus drentensis TaxID=220684 RepID=UPI002FFE225A
MNKKFIGGIIAALIIIGNIFIFLENENEEYVEAFYDIYDSALKSEMPPNWDPICYGIRN